MHSEHSNRVTVSLSGIKADHPRLFLSFVLAFVLLAATEAWFAYDVLVDLPAKDALGALGDAERTTTVYDYADRSVFTVLKEQRIDVTLDKISPYLTQAVVAIEDQRFFAHRGIDVPRIAAAAYANVRYRRAAQGGSTLTQQLARQSFLTRDKTLRRKAKEIILAARLERLYTKQEILELYLNRVYFGDGLYGAESAAQGYFGKPAQALTLGEGALLAGLLKSPSNYAPTMNPERAISRRTLVLRAMLDLGMISRPQWQEASTSVQSLRSSLHRNEPFGMYFKEQVRLELVQRFGPERVYAGGLKVYTTIDPEMQSAAESLVDQALQEIEARRQTWQGRRSKSGVAPSEPEPLQAALIAMDPRTGDVRAMVGGRNFDQSRFNRAMWAKRQPGSAFKPFVYAAAIEAGYEPASVIDRLGEPVWTPAGYWTPEDGHSEDESMTLRAALRVSSNRAAVRLLDAVGIPQVVEYAKRVGIDSMPAVPSLALGSGEVTLASLTAGYVPFANGGFAVRPTILRRVVDRDGTVLFTTEERPRRAIAETTAFLMTSMLSDVVNAGTAAKARRFGFTLPAAGKTGTTNDFGDAWFVGFTPNLATGVWVGFDRPHMILPNGYGGELAVPLWARFMKVATRRDPPIPFKAPPGIVGVQVCRASGMLPSDGCRQVHHVTDAGALEIRSLIYTDYFTRGTEPTEICALHQAIVPFGRPIGTLGMSHGLPAPPESSGLAALLPSSPPPSSLPEALADAPLEPTPDTVQEAPKPRRGFWGRVFGARRATKDK